MVRYIAILAVIFLSACGLFMKEAQDLPCPETGLINHADTVSLPTADVTIEGFKGTCSLKRRPSEIRVELSLPFKALRKPAAGKAENAEVSYFISVLGPDESILQRQMFSTKVAFDNVDPEGNIEVHQVKIPMVSPAEAYKYKIVFGFVLTPQQLQYNKEKI